jgi:ribose transport system permease protein
MPQTEEPNPEDGGGTRRRPDLLKPSFPTLRRLLMAPEAGVLMVIIALWVWVLVSGRMGEFGGAFNRESLARSVSLQSIFAVGELLVILTGGIDLSLGSLIAFDGMLLARVMTSLADRGVSIGLATAGGIGAVLLFSLSLGVMHATVIQFLRLPPFVVTLASMSMLRSGALLLNNAVPLPIERFGLITFLGNGKVYVVGSGIGIPIPAIVLMVIAAVIIGILGFTPIGRRVYSVGSNEEASRLSGVNVYKVRLFVYGTCSLLGGIAAVLFAGYSGQGDPGAGVMFELNAISATVIGGAVLTGGRGSVIGTILGATLLEWILNLINLTLANPTFWRGMVVGGVLMAAVIFNQVRRMRSLRDRR